MNQLRPLHPHQQLALDMLCQAFVDGKRRPMLQAPTGAGKTVIGAHMVSRAIAKRKRLTFCVPAIGLVDQTFERFAENGIDPANLGVIQANHPWRRPHAPIQIATPQTLARRSRPISDCVVFDEAHELFSIYVDWMQDPEWAAVPFIGLSATPWAKGLGKYFDCLLRPTSTYELIAGGFLSPYRVFAPSSPDLSNVETVAGDYHEGQLGEVMGNAQLVADVVETWLQLGENRPTLCFAVNRAHARQLAGQFSSAGVPTAYVDANTPREERTEIGRKLGSGAIKVVVNIGCLTKGIDWDVRCLILARPTKSEMLFVQIIGRALRTAPGKDYALILDHSDTHARLGMVADIDHEELCDGNKRKASAKEKAEREERLPKPCTTCGCLVPVGEKACASCGTIMQRPVEIVNAEGTLSEIGGGPKAKRERSVDVLAQMPKREVHAQLCEVAHIRGRSDGWIAHTYREIFGVWPRNLDKLDRMEPCLQLLAFVRAKDIRYAKGKEASKAAEARQ